MKKNIEKVKKQRFMPLTGIDKSTILPVKCRIHINTDLHSFLGDDVYVDIVLATLPRDGDWIWLDESSLNELEKKAKSSLKVARRYINWFYYKSSNIKAEDLTRKNLEDLSFADASYALDVVLQENCEYANVILTDCYIRKND